MRLKLPSTTGLLVTKQIFLQVISTTHYRKQCLCVWYCIPATHCVVASVMAASRSSWWGSRESSMASSYRLKELRVCTTLLGQDNTMHHTPCQDWLTQWVLTPAGSRPIISSKSAFGGTPITSVLWYRAEADSLWSMLVTVLMHIHTRGLKLKLLVMQLLLMFSSSKNWSNRPTHG